MISPFLRLALVLGLLSAIGPFAIDMYLPALPAIGNSLGADVGAVQLSLTAFFAAVSVSQLAYGPASDLFGRKAPLLFGLVLFTLASVGCALAPNIHTLVVFRFVQGLGAGAAMTIPRAVVRDVHTGNDAARLMSLLMLVFSVSPILAPLVGSLVVDAAGWRGIFWLVTGAGVAGLALLVFVLDETRPAADRAASTWRGSVSAYGRLMRDRHFLGLTFIGAFGMASFFVFLANSSFVMINHYGLSPRQYSVAFSINAVSFIGASQLTGWFAQRFGLHRTVRGAVVGFTATMVLLLVVFTAGVDRLDVLAALLFAGFGFLGLVIPATSVLALEDHGEIAGVASALMGTLQLVTGAIVMGFTGLFLDGTAFPMVAGITFCAMVAMGFTQLTLAGFRSPVPQVSG
ncbi:multidrug effflux MFS transporter [Rhizobacter sp. Root1221]|uniref:multidrug effflux MFS transporter n=1 Tax=Rhizobacter sp. Root1221 TaxID=1736433 RepID=UPI0006FF1486|nr:multidrug effflux MFS transporter [Rhizobacter sp. Root1221]KQV95181.1 MFS transporter [Rhizobacter sp. Root1221]